MKKIFTLLLMVAMISSISFAQDSSVTEGTTNGPTMTFESMTVDYGTIEQNSDPLRSCLLYTSPSPRDQRGSRMPSSA